MPALDKVSDTLERGLAHALALPVFTAAFVAGMALAGVDVTNIAVSYFTVALLLLGMSRARRDRMAAQVKLDDLEARLPEATTENVALEEATEEEIRSRRETKT